MKYKEGANPVYYCLDKLVGSQACKENSNLWCRGVIATFRGRNGKKMSKLSKISKYFSAQVP